MYSDSSNDNINILDGVSKKLFAGKKVIVVVMVIITTIIIIIIIMVIIIVSVLTQFLFLHNKVRKAAWRSAGSF